MKFIKQAFDIKKPMICWEKANSLMALNVYGTPFVYKLLLAITPLQNFVAAYLGIC